MRLRRSIPAAPAAKSAGRPPGAWAVAGLICAAVPGIWAQDDLGPAAPAAPEFLSARSAIPPELLTRKKDGWYVTGFPALGGDSEYGFTGGVQAQIYDNGPRDSAFFPWTPYRKKITGGATVATEGREQAFVTLDVPAVADTPWRVRVYGGYLHDERAPYFGVGSATLGPLTYPGSSQSYSQYRDYEGALDEVQDGQTWSRYDRFDRRQWLGSVNLEYALAGGRLRPMLAFAFSHLAVEDYTGQELDGGMQQPTHLFEDYASGRITGFNGGWDNSFRFGLAYDTRDYEPDPTRGMLAQFLVAGYVPGLGSSQTYGHVTGQFTGFAPLFPSHLSRLVWVVNGGYSFKFGDAPFYAMPLLPLPSNEVRHGLGGFYALRGYNSDRFTGKAGVYTSTELRWTFAEATFLKQHLRFTLAPFIDGGRVFDGALDFSLNHWKVTGGAGLRLAWNLATVISVDVGVSSENTMIYAEVGHSF